MDKLREETGPPLSISYSNTLLQVSVTGHRWRHHAQLGRLSAPSMTVWQYVFFWERWSLEARIRGDGHKKMLSEYNWKRLTASFIIPSLRHSNKYLLILEQAKRSLYEKKNLYYQIHCLTELLLCCYWDSMFLFLCFTESVSLAWQEPERLWTPLCPSLCTSLNLQLTAPFQADAHAAELSQDIKKPKSKHSTSWNTAKLERWKIHKPNAQGTQGISRVQLCDVRCSAETQCASTWDSWTGWGNTWGGEDQNRVINTSVTEIPVKHWVSRPAFTNFFLIKVLQKFIIDLKWFDFLKKKNKFPQINMRPLIT